jgi:general secretion pathway protein G
MLTGPHKVAILKSMRHLSKRGFTLLELLVVISIIGILVALGAVSYTTAQQKGRDAKRRGDLKSIQSAFEQYYAENGTYEITCSDMATATTMPAGLPQDPKPSPHPVYATSCTASTYCICATLENETGNSSATDCSDWTAGEVFCVANLQ